MTTTRPSEARRHHYVPKLLLKGFATLEKSGVYRTRVFDKRTGRTHGSPIKDVMLEGDFNSLELPNGQRLSIEEHISRFEDTAAPLIRRIVDHRSVAVLSENERLELARFVALQFIRGTAHRAIADDTIKQLAAEMMDRGFPEDLAPNFDPDQIKAYGLLSVLDSLDHFASYMATKHLILVQAPLGAEFMLGDNPVSLMNSEPAGFFGNLGIASKGIQIYLPLTSEFTLGLWCPSIGDQIMDGQKKVRTKIGNLKAMSLLGRGTTPLPPEHIAELDAALEGLNLVDSVFLEGAPFPLDASNVLHLNFLQVAHAERFVVSATGDFELVQRMLADNDEFKIGRRMKVS